jgi:AcrR family transcriptional regulator
MGESVQFRSLDRSLRKQRIIDTAADLFHKKGYQSTTLQDVSEALGVTKAALYHYVKSKDDLLWIIYTQAFENIFRDTDRISTMDLPPDEKLRRVIRNHIKNIIIKDLSMFSVFFSEDHQLPQKDVRRIREEKRRYTQIIEDIIQDGIRKGLFVQADPRLQAYGILGMCNWIYTWYRPGKTKYEPEEIADYFVSLLEGGYLSPAMVVGDGDPGPRRPKQHKGVAQDRKLEELRSLLKRVQELVDDMGNLPEGG